MNFLILGVTHWRIVSSSTHIVSDIVNLYYGHAAAVIVSVLVALTAYGSVYSLMMSYSRIPYAAAKDGFFFDWLKGIHPLKHFPHYSLLVVGTITCLASLFSLEFIISATLSSRILIQFLGQIVGLTILRKTQPDLYRPYKMWLYPLPSIIAFIGFAFIFISSGIEAIGLGLLWLLVGIIFFIFWAKKNNEWPFKSIKEVEVVL
jgi:amino acid transporter